MRNIIRLCALLFGSAAPAYAQDITGNWYGVIDGFTYGEDRRNLTIHLGNPTPTCTWEEIGKKSESPICFVSGNEVSLTTRPGSKVYVKMVGGSLVGTFTPSDGRTYRITMGRSPVPITENASLVGTWEGEIHCEKQSVAKMEWRITGQTPDGHLDGNAFVAGHRSGWRFEGAKVRGKSILLHNYERMVVSGNRIGGYLRSRTDLCDVFLVKQ